MVRLRSMHHECGVMYHQTHGNFAKFDGASPTPPAKGCPSSTSDGKLRETHMVGKSPLAVDPPTKRADVSGEYQTREMTTRFKRAKRRGCSLLTLNAAGASCRVHDRLMALGLTLHSICSPATWEMLPARRFRSQLCKVLQVV
jgi:hypothetical protein